MSSPFSFLQALQYFKDKRLLTIFCFGIASGFPWVLIGSAMTGWLKDEALSRSSIGLFGLIFACYSVNFLWSPLVDRLKIPIFSRMGQRRSWILLTQLVIVAFTLSISQLDVQSNLSMLALFGLIIAFAGASQDISIDAYRIDILQSSDSNYMAAGSAMATAGWWTGYAGLGAIPFLLADSPSWQWSEVYLVLGAVMLVLTATAWLVKEPDSNRESEQKAIELNYQEALSNYNGACLPILLMLPAIILTIAYANFGYPYWPENGWLSESKLLSVSIIVFTLLILFIRQLIGLNKRLNVAEHNNSAGSLGSTERLTAWLLTTLVAPIQEFFDRNGAKLALSILLFVFLFKLGEAYLGRMSVVFYREVGFSNADIAYYSKMINWGVTIVFSLIGSLFTIHYGILKGLFIGGIAMASSNLLFALMAVVGPDKALFAFTVFADGFTSAWGSVAFVALLSVLCNKTFTASQYALMASLGTFGRVMVGSYSGILVDWLDGNWALFFILTALMVIPSLLFLYSIKEPLNKLIAQADSKNN